MADKPVFQGHHLIEQVAAERSALLDKLSERGLFDVDGPRNMLNLPVDEELGAKLGVSRHPGGPLRQYSRGVREFLNELENSDDGAAALDGDRAAAQRVVTRVNDFTDTLKAGLVNGDLVTNASEGMSRKQANTRIQEFFDDLDGYQQRHAEQIAELASMPEAEARWAGVTQSERNVNTAIDAIEQPGARAIRLTAPGGRHTLAEAAA